MSRTSGGTAGGVDTSMGLLIGESSIPRLQATTAQAVGNGVIRLGIFRAGRTENVTQVRMLSGATAAVAATTAKMGVYEITQQGDGSWLANLIAQTASDLALFAAAQTVYTRALLAGFQKIAGHYYGVTPFVLGTTTSPTIVGSAVLPQSVVAGDAALGPPILTIQTALADLPAQQAIPGNSTPNNTPVPYGVLLP